METSTTLTVANSRSAVHVSPAVLVGAGVSVTAFVVYLLTLMPTVYFVDGGELTTAAYTLGITHPPGYPLYTLLGWAFTHLPLGEDAAWRLNLLSAIFGAVAVGVFYALVYQVLLHLPLANVTAKRGRAAAPAPPSQARRKPRKGEVQKADAAKADPNKATVAMPAPESTSDNPQAIITIVTALAAAGLLGFGITFWNWAVQGKMYTLHWLFVAALFLVALLVNRASGAPTAAEVGYFRAMPGDVRRLHTLAFLAGLSLTNHATAAVILPGVAVLAIAGGNWTGRLRRILRYLPTLLPTFILPLALYIYVPLRAQQNPLLNWGIARDWPNFVRHVTGWQYSNILFNPVPDAVSKNLNIWATQYNPLLGVLIVALAIAGLIRLLQTNRVLLAATTLTALLSSIYAFSYGIREIEAYHVPLYMMVMLWLAVGLAWLLQWAMAMISNVQAKRLLPFSALLLPLLALALNWGFSDHHNDYLAPTYARNAFKDFAPNALVISDQWDFVSATLYLQYIRGERPDLKIIDVNLLKYPWYMDYLERQYPDILALAGDIEPKYRAEQEKFVSGTLADNGPISQYYFQMLQDITQKSLPNRAVYGHFPSLSRGGQPTNEQKVILGQFYHPEGLAYRIDSAAGKFTLQAPDWDLRGITSDAVPMDYIARNIAATYPSALRQIGNYMVKNGQTQPGQQLLAEADRLVAILTEQYNRTGRLV